MQAPEQVKRDLVRQERVHGHDDGDPDRAPDEDEALAVDVGNAAPQQEEAAEGEGVGREEPLETAVGDVEVAADGGQQDDDDLVGDGLFGDESGCC